MSLSGGRASGVWIYLSLADLIDCSLLTGDAEGGADGGWAETSTRVDPKAARLLSQVENVFSDLCLTCCPVGLGLCVCLVVRVYIREARKYRLAEIHTDQP